MTIHPSYTEKAKNHDEQLSRAESNLAYALYKGFDTTKQLQVVAALRQAGALERIADSMERGE